MEYQYIFLYCCTLFGSNEERMLMQSYFGEENQEIMEFEQYTTDSMCLQSAMPVNDISILEQEQMFFENLKDKNYTYLPSINQETNLSRDLTFTEDEYKAMSTFSDTQIDVYDIGNPSSPCFWFGEGGEYADVSNNQNMHFSPILCLQDEKQTLDTEAYEYQTDGECLIGEECLPSFHTFGRTYNTGKVCPDLTPSCEQISSDTTNTVHFGTNTYVDSDQFEHQRLLPQPNCSKSTNQTHTNERLEETHHEEQKQHLSESILSELVQSHGDDFIREIKDIVKFFGDWQNALKNKNIRRYCIYRAKINRVCRNMLLREELYNYFLDKNKTKKAGHGQRHFYMELNYMNTIICAFNLLYEFKENCIKILANFKLNTCPGNAGNSFLPFSEVSQHNVLALLADCEVKLQAYVAIAHVDLNITPTELQDKKEEWGNCNVMQLMHGIQNRFCNIDAQKNPKEDVSSSQKIACATLDNYPDVYHRLLTSIHKTTSCKLEKIDEILRNIESVLEQMQAGAILQIDFGSICEKMRLESLKLLNYKSFFEAYQTLKLIKEFVMIKDNEEYKQTIALELKNAVFARFVSYVGFALDFDRFVITGNSPLPTSVDLIEILKRLQVRVESMKMQNEIFGEHFCAQASLLQKTNSNPYAIYKKTCLEFTDIVVRDAIYNPTKVVYETQRGLAFAKSKKINGSSPLSAFGVQIGDL